MAWPAIVAAAASSKGGDKGGGGGGGGVLDDWDPAKKGLGDVGGVVGSVSDFKRQKAEDAAAQEYANQWKSENAYNYGQAMDTYDRGVELAPTLGSVNTADYDSSAYHMPTSRDQIGGEALKTQLQSSQGYNPTMSANPYLNIFGADQAAVEVLRTNSEASAERTLSDWEASQGELAGQLDQSFADIRSDRDAMVDDYTAVMGDAESDRNEDLAKRIVESWEYSKDSASAGEFTNGGGGLSKGGKAAAGIAGASGLLPGSEAIGGIIGKRRRNKAGRVSGKAKQAYIADRIAAGESYSDILNDPDFVADHIVTDKNAKGLYGEWED